MARFLLRRAPRYLVLVAIAASLGYLLAASTLNPRSNFENRNPPPPKASVDRRLDDLNMNDETPVMRRFATWVADVAHLDLGETVTGQRVSEEMGRRMGVSLRLLLIASVLGTTIGVAVGFISAVKHHSLTDRTLTFGAFVLLATPVFLLAVLLKVGGLELNQAVGRTILYNTGEATPGLTSGAWSQLVDRLQHLVLPTLALVLPSVAFYSRYQRNAMLDVLGSDFLRTARAKGLRRRQALMKHGLRTALLPMVTYFAYEVGLLLVGTAFVEKIFGWHGMGEWFVDSLSRQDINAVAAFTLFSAVLVLLAGIISDLALAALDPRVRAA